MYVCTKFEEAQVDFEIYCALLSRSRDVIGHETIR